MTTEPPDLDHVEQLSCPVKDIANRDWPVAIVGGGPAALLQINQGSVSRQEVLLVTEQVGGSIAYLGRQRLQSYTHELDIGRSRGLLQRLVGFSYLQPTADEYTRYICDQLMLSGVTILRGAVSDVHPGSNMLIIETNTYHHGDVRLRARYVVLATGTTPKQPSTGGLGVPIAAFDQVYWDIQSGRYDQYQGKSIIIVGSGNTALQTASLLAAVARDIIILAKHYKGLYPQETADRFAWRCASQLTCELITKSARQCSPQDGMSSCVRLIIYETLHMKNRNTLAFTYRPSSNTRLLCQASLPPRCAHLKGRVSVLPNGCFEETRDLRDTVIVWAVGIEPNYPKGKSVSSLPRDDAGFITKDEVGETEMRGLYLVGACAGARAVNEMRPVVIGKGNEYLKQPVKSSVNG